MSDQRRYLSLREAARSMGCSERFLRRCVAEGELETYLVRGRRFTSHAAVDVLMHRNRNRHPDRGRGARPKPASLQPSDPAQGPFLEESEGPTTDQEVKS
jgi:excisionase family DNA binding protein